MGFAENWRRLSLIATTLTLAALTGLAPAQHASIDRIVAFGSSLSDTGNAFIVLSDPANQACGAPLNVPPYDTLDDLLTPDGPYAKGGHHFSNGATWIEGVTRYLALGGNARPAFRNTDAKASNYAVGGARANADYPCRVNLPEQVTRYLENSRQTSERTLITVEIGANDLKDALLAIAMSGDPNAGAAILQGALQSLGDSIVELYFNGARRFLIVNVPDISNTPAVQMLGQPAVSVAQQLAQAFNFGLATLVAGLETGFADMNVKVLDLYTLVNDVIASPETYGFANVTQPCVTPNQPPFTCKDPDSYVFWDGIHPTKALHAIVAQQAIAQISAP